MEIISEKKKFARRSIFTAVLAICFAIFMTNSCYDDENLLPEGDEDWSFIVFGDLRQGFSVYDILVKSMAKIKPTPKLAICGGDIMETPNNSFEWKSFWEHSKPVTDLMPMHIARGNHEGTGPESERTFREQTKLKSTNFYYSFTESNARFIICDTEIQGAGGGIVGEQFSWLANELNIAERDDSVQNIFISFHRPLFPQGSHYGETMVNAYELHDLLLQADKLRAVFVSHDHIFNRLTIDGVEYITTGGAGAYLHRNRGGDYHHYLKVSIKNETNRINIKAIGVFNEVVEDFDL